MVEDVIPHISRPSEKLYLWYYQHIMRRQDSASPLMKCWGISSIVNFTYIENCDIKCVRSSLRTSLWLDTVWYDIKVIYPSLLCTWWRSLLFYVQQLSSEASRRQVIHLWGILTIWKPSSFILYFIFVFCFPLVFNFAFTSLVWSLILA